MKEAVISLPTYAMFPFGVLIPAIQARFALPAEYQMQLNLSRSPPLCDFIIFLFAKKFILISQHRSEIFNKAHRGAYMVMYSYILVLVRTKRKEKIQQASYHNRQNTVVARFLIYLETSVQI
jgi:hypothetical protein